MLPGGPQYTQPAMPAMLHPKTERISPKIHLQVSNIYIYIIYEMSFLMVMAPFFPFYLFHWKKTDSVVFIPDFHPHLSLYGLVGPHGNQNLHALGKSHAVAWGPTKNYESHLGCEDGSVQIYGILQGKWWENIWIGGVPNVQTRFPRCGVLWAIFA